MTPCFALTHVQQDVYYECFGKNCPCYQNWSCHNGTKLCYIVKFLGNWMNNGEQILEILEHDTFDDKSTWILFRVMAWRRQATNHYLSLWWPTYMWPYVWASVPSHYLHQWWLISLPFFIENVSSNWKHVTRWRDWCDFGNSSHIIAAVGTH